MSDVRPTQRVPVLRALRSVSVLAILTIAALYVTRGDVVRPHGNPLLYAVAVSWLISVGVGLPASIIFRVNTGLLPLARWERDGDVYDRSGVRAFRWMLLRSPLGWINPNTHVLVRIPFDLYPIMLLRRTRGRVGRLLRRRLRTPASGVT